MKNNDKKANQLGMPLGTASNRLRKSIIFSLIKETNKNICFQCGKEIESEKELSIEHKVPYLDSKNPVELFFDLNNIAFSHLSCNCRAATLNLERTIRDSSTGYRGILIPTSRHSKYRAKIKKDGKDYIIGSYNTALEAALAYDKKAEELHGDKAITNKKLGNLAMQFTG